MSYNTRTNAYRSSNSVIVSGPGTMYNESTRPRSYTKQYNDNTNTYNVTVPYIKISRSNTKVRKSKSTNNTKTQ